MTNYPHHPLFVQLWPCMHARPLCPRFILYFVWKTSVLRRGDVGTERNGSVAPLRVSLVFWFACFRVFYYPWVGLCWVQTWRELRHAVASFCKILCYTRSSVGPNRNIPGDNNFFVRSWTELTWRVSSSSYGIPPAAHWENELGRCFSHNWAISHSSKLTFEGVSRTC